ncbi:MAG: hypothetical protein M1834_004344 [Cirrosporium novae-zelandiae]|nr:MAG: hypothetical protein M1834_004344 [Cirrosporium novae-zelandiae]
MDSPLSPKPRSAVPSYLANGTSHLHASTTTRNDIETENLKTSIGSSYERPPAYHFDEEGKPTLARTVDGVKSTRKQATNHALQNGSRTTLTEDARDLSDHPHTPPLTASRPASPYTLNPPIDFDGLSWPCIGTRARKESTPEETEQRILKISNAVRDIFEALGEDPNREGLRGTPERYAKAMMFFTKGYEENVRDLVNNAVFHEDHDELVMVKDIEVFSLCEHHMVPFIGKMHGDEGSPKDRIIDNN